MTNNVPLQLAIAFTATMLSSANAQAQEFLFHYGDRTYAQEPRVVAASSIEHYMHVIAHEEESSERDAFIEKVSVWGHGDHQTSIAFGINRDSEEFSQLENAVGLVITTPDFDFQTGSCVFVPRDSVSVEVLGLNRFFDRAVLHASEEVQDAVFENDCLAFERRNGPALL